jgi:hypothetical protein
VLLQSSSYSSPSPLRSLYYRPAPRVDAAAAAWHTAPAPAPTSPPPATPLGRCAPFPRAASRPAPATNHRRQGLQGRWGQHCKGAGNSRVVSVNQGPLRNFGK